MNNEQLSAWIDGELGSEDAKHVLNSVARQSAQRDRCEAYWLIGDSLRAEPALSADFTARVMSAVQSEPTVLAPVARPVEKVETPRWMPMAAAVAGIAVVGGMAATLNVASNPQPQTSLAATATMTPVAARRGTQAVTFSDDRAYMIAHQAYGAGTPMAGVAMYIRTVGDEQVGSAR